MWDGAAPGRAVLLQLRRRGSRCSAHPGQAVGQAIVRIITVLGFFFSGGFVGIAYLAGWIGIPEEHVPMPGPMSGPYPPNL